MIASYSSTITLKFVLYDFLKFYLSENHHAASYNVVTSWTLVVVVVVVYCLKVFKYMTVTSCCSFAFITTLSGKKTKNKKR